ncbi:apolipoprotein L3-like [Latimeria chalumnae]|uniref:apolipoprotein L3-like n=1 Tax=Latimeria chalumnae TaxID=7897 RepID=UPI0003C11F87|nr:PREDICTED: apolipoprotein L3-like [Latimeria chalumnae]|eukprot:XP_006013529.1 PREDICTED: apolipoprotein L3-like [Latimeria chalumnae]
MAEPFTITDLEMALLEIRNEKQKLSKQEIDTFDISETAIKIKQFHYYIYNFDDIFDRWVTSRKETIHKLRELAEEIHTHRKKVNIAEVSGASVGIVGGGLAIAGLILAPFTVGVSVGLTIAGVITGVAGGLTSLGATVTEGRILKDKRVQVQEVLKRDEIQSTEMRNMLNVSTDLSNRLQELLDNIDFIVKWKPLGIIEQILMCILEMLKICLKFKDTVQEVRSFMGERHISAIIMSVSSAAKLSGVLAMSGTKAIARGAHLFGIALSTVFVFVDAITVAQTAIDLSNGSPSEVAENLKVIAGELEIEMEKLDYCANRFKQLAEEYKCATGNFAGGSSTFDLP